MRRRTLRDAMALLAAVVALVGCSASGDGSSAARAATAASPSAPAVDYAALVDDIAPLARPLGWDVQRAYRAPAAVAGEEVDLVNVYLRPAGPEPSADGYVADSLVALRTIASHVFEADPDVSAVDVCLQRPNDAPSSAEVEPAVRMLGLRSDLEPMLAGELDLATLVQLSRAGRFILYGDRGVAEAPTWIAARGVGTSG